MNRDSSAVKNKSRTLSSFTPPRRERKAAADLEFETAARLRDEIKRLKLLDLEFANEMATPEGEAVDRGVVKEARAKARAEAQERFRKGRR